MLMSFGIFYLHGLVHNLSMAKLYYHQDDNTPCTDVIRITDEGCKMPNTVPGRISECGSYFISTFDM